MHPASTVVVGEQDVALLTSSQQSLFVTSDVEKQTLQGKIRLQRR